MTTKKTIASLLIFNLLTLSLSNPTQAGHRTDRARRHYSQILKTVEQWQIETKAPTDRTLFHDSINLKTVEFSEEEIETIEFVQSGIVDTEKLRQCATDRKTNQSQNESIKKNHCSLFLCSGAVIAGASLLSMLLTYYFWSQPECLALDPLYVTQCYKVSNGTVITSPIDQTGRCDHTSGFYFDFAHPSAALTPKGCGVPYCFDDKNTPWPRLTLHSQDQTAFYISLGTFLMTVAAETIYHLAAPSKRSRAQRQASLPDPVEDHEALQASRANVLKGSTLPHFSAVLEYLEARVQVVIQDI
jgi:hypothetical protein